MVEPTVMLSLQVEIAQMMNNKCSSIQDNHQPTSYQSNDKKYSNLLKVRKLLISATTKSIFNSSFNDKNKISINNYFFSCIDTNYNNNLNNSSFHLIFFLFHLIHNLLNDVISKNIQSFGRICFILSRKILVILIKCKCLKILKLIYHLNLIRYSLLSSFI